MSDAETVEKNKIKLETPKNYNVIFYNDDVTPMDFVVQILVVYFSYDEQMAKKIMMKIHNEKKAIVGTYYSEVALTKAESVTYVARSNGYPLKVVAKPE